MNDRSIMNSIRELDIKFTVKKNRKNQKVLNKICPSIIKFDFLKLFLIFILELPQLIHCNLLDSFLVYKF